MGNIKAIILNPEVQKSWSEFVDWLPEGGFSRFSIRESNKIYDKHLDLWATKTAKKHCPPDVDYRDVKKVLIDHFGA